MSQNKTINRCNNCNSKIPEEQLDLIKENQEAVFCPYCGDPLFLKKKFNDNQTSNNEFLKDKNSPNINQYKRESFEYYITIFAARIIYDSIIQADVNSKPIESYIDKLAPALRIKFSDKPINQEWLEVFRDNSKKKFKKRYKEFQTTLKRNAKYQENFLIYLIKSVFDLNNSENELSTLDGIKRDIANDLINRKLFETDRRFPEVFKQNLIIALSRLIYIKIKFMAQKRNAKVSLVDLDQNVIAKMAESTKNNVITLTEINPQYLNKLYGMTLNQFNAAYQKLRTELNASKIYSESFRYLLQRLIKNVNLLLSSKRDRASLSNLEQIVIFELKTLEITLQKNPNVILESSESKNLNVNKEKTYIETDEKEPKSQLGKNNNQNAKKASNIKFTLGEIDFLKSKGIDIYNLKSRWEWVNKELAKSFLEEVVISDQSKIPSYKKVRELGYRGFINAIKSKLNLTYNDLIEEAGHNINNKYDLLRFDDQGKNLTRNESLKATYNYISEIIIPDLIGKGILNKGDVPSTTLLRNNGYSGYLWAIASFKWKFTYSEVLSQGGLKTTYKRKYYKWAFLDYSEEGLKFSIQQSISAAAKYLIEKIIPDLIDKCIIEEDQSPRYNHLKKFGHYDFLSAIKERKISFPDVLKEGDLDEVKRKYYFLDFDNEGNPLIHDQSVRAV